MKHKIWGFAAFFICCWLVFIARHHPPSRRKIKQIWHGRVFWEKESNTTMLRSSVRVINTTVGTEITKNRDIIEKTVLDKVSANKHIMTDARNVVFSVSDKLDIENTVQTQERLLYMLTHFTRIAEKYDIKYWLCAGTLIGAIRHHGFIPWGADIDISIPYDSYLKLQNAAEQELPSDLWLQDWQSDPLYKHGSRLPKIRDLNSDYTAWSANHKDWHNGIQLDLNIIRDNQKCFLKQCCNSIEEAFPLKRVPFEHITVLVPQKHTSILKKFYGNIDVPPVNKRIHHQGKASFKAPGWVKKKYPQLYNVQKSISSEIESKENYRREMQVMVSVLSRRSAFETRQVIRETWASGHNNVFFAVGVCCSIPPEDRKKWTCKRAKPTSVQEQSKWDMKCAKQDLKIAEEESKYKDIIRMPDIDVYRHLPQKVKFSYKWGLEHTTAKWFVKTDDDSVVRIDTLGSYLQKTYNSDEYVVVGRISNGWSVPRSGKWAENNYKPSKYPKFPLGSVGHVVSKGVATYIVDNSDKLFNYQGEDVSIGIWLNESPLKSEVKWVTSKHMTNHGNCKDTGMWVMGHNIKPAKMRECFAHKDEIKSASEPQTIYAGVKLIGGLGNNLFMLASIRGIAHKNKAIPCYSGSSAAAKELIEIDIKKCPSESYVKQSENGYAKYAPFEMTKSTTIGTFLQSYKYFKSIPPFKIKQNMNSFAQKYVKTHSNKATNVGIHVRRGDHLKHGYLNFPGEQYFKNAMQYFTRKYGDVQFFVASNDISWCKKQSFFKGTHIISEKHTAAQDMAILANCDHVIISLGTFGWWAGLFSGGEVVYYVDEFDMKHKINKGKVVKQDYYPPEWKKLSASAIALHPKHINTIVTAYFEIDKSKHTTSEYDAWMRNMLSLQDAMVIFASPELVSKIESLRAHAMDRTKIISMELSDTMMVSKYSMDFWKKQSTKDPEKYHSPELYIIWQEKTNFLKRAKDLNPFGSDFFAWVDIGYFRNDKYNNQMMIQKIPDNLRNNQVMLLDVTSLVAGLPKRITGDGKYLGGGFIGGYGDGIDYWYNTYYSYLDSKKTEFIGTDQPRYYQTCALNKGLCNIVQPKSGYGDKWFYMAPYLSGTIPVAQLLSLLGDKPDTESIANTQTTSQSKETSFESKSINKAPYRTTMTCREEQCLFENICINENGEYAAFGLEHKIPTLWYKSTISINSNPRYKPMNIHTSKKFIPVKYTFADTNSVFTEIHRYYLKNYGHTLGDDVFAIFRGIDEWNLTKFDLHIMTNDVSRSEQFELVTHNLVSLRKKGPVCFPRFLAGWRGFGYVSISAAEMLKFDTWAPTPKKDVQIGMRIRRFRDFARKMVGLNIIESPKCILIVKKNIEVARRKSVITNLDKLKDALERREPQQCVKIVGWAGMPIKEQLSILSRANTLMVLPGADAMNSIFLSDNSLVILPDRLYKGKWQGSDEWRCWFKHIDWLHVDTFRPKISSRTHSSYDIDIDSILSHFTHKLITQKPVHSPYNQVQVFLLTEFVNALNEINIIVTLNAGSLLAFWRHPTKFIPHDNDMDVTMLWDDYYINGGRELMQRFGEMSNWKFLPVSKNGLGHQAQLTIHFNNEQIAGLDVFLIKPIGNNRVEHTSTWWAKRQSIAHAQFLPRIPCSWVGINTHCPFDTEGLLRSIYGDIDTVKVDPSKIRTQTWESAENCFGFLKSPVRFSNIRNGLLGDKKNPTNAITGNQTQMTFEPNSIDKSKCLQNLAMNMPIDKNGVMKVHHWGARSNKWNEKQRWLPMNLVSPCMIWYVGANTHGRDGVKLQQKYNCNIHVFEPVPSFAKQLVENWKNVPRSKVHAFGLGAKTRTISGVKVEHESTFAMVGGKDSSGETVQIKSIVEAWEELGKPPIDLLHMNCEGCEWEMLETLISSEIIHKVRILQVGTHWFADVKNIKQRYCTIESKLATTHKKIYQQYFGWERWERSESQKAGAERKPD